MINKKAFYPLLVIIILMTACSGRPPSIPGFPDSSDRAPSRKLDPHSIENAVPRAEQRSRSGNPSSYVVFGKRYHVMPSSDGFVERGLASWYGTKFHGRKTSSGEVYDMYAMTAAHKNLPLPTYVEVTHLDNGRKIIVKVNDRGPFHQGRIIDLSYAAATKLGITGKGTGRVEVRAINPGRVTQSPPPPRAAAPRQPTDSSLFIQVGSFSSHHNATQMQQRLSRTLNQATRIQQAESRGASVFRVQVGPLPSIAQADSLNRELSRMGINETRVILE